MNAVLEYKSERRAAARETLESAVVRFAGDSGDGMQLAGGRFTLAAALGGANLTTFPDFPAEIRAPVGTTYGVSSFQINFGAREIRTIGDHVDVLAAMNPAALRVNIDDLRDDGLLIVDDAQFRGRHLTKAGYGCNPLDSGELDRVRVLRLDISGLTLAAVKALGDVEVSNKESLRARNMWVLGLTLWLFDHDTADTAAWVQAKFADQPDIARINAAALEAGHAFAETAELAPPAPAFSVPPARIRPGVYRNVTGAEGVCWGLAAGAALAGRGLTYCSYPITPASSMLHEMTRMGAKHGVVAFQAEDEIAAACAAIGASYAGRIGVSGSSGPGVALMTEALGLAVAVELPLVVVNAQRGGPSTGLPTKTEQSDLHQAVYGRNADTPLVVLAARAPGDCFETAIEAVRLAIKFMTPVILLTDGFLANASEPWLIPDAMALARFEVSADLPADAPPFARDANTLARPWIAPGAPGRAHRIGGLERAAGTGEVSYDPANHAEMTRLRAAKVRGVAKYIPLQAIELGEARGDLAIVGWGSTFGAINRAVGNLRAQGHRVSQIHLRHIWPLPDNIVDLLAGYKAVLIPEMNMGQLATVLRAECLVATETLTKVNGKPFLAVDIEHAASRILKGLS